MPVEERIRFAMWTSNDFLPGPSGVGSADLWDSVSVCINAHSHAIPMCASHRVRESDRAEPRSSGRDSDSLRWDLFFVCVVGGPRVLCGFRCHASRAKTQAWQTSRISGPQRIAELPIVVLKLWSWETQGKTSMCTRVVGSVLVFPSHVVHDGHCSIKEA